MPVQHALDDFSLSGTQVCQAEYLMQAFFQTILIGLLDVSRRAIRIVNFGLSSFRPPFLPVELGCCCASSGSSVCLMMMKNGGRFRAAPNI